MQYQGKFFGGWQVCYRLGHSTVCVLIEDMCDAIWNALASEYLRTPSSEAEWKKISDGFYRVWGFHIV